MQFQLRLFSAIVVAVAATQSKPYPAELTKEHVALVQHHASVFTAKETKPAHDDTNLAATNTSQNAYVCPYGYWRTPQNLKGESAIKGSESVTMADCEAACAARDGCTGFEVGWTSGWKGCWTYTGGSADIQTGLFNGQGLGWASCIRFCPQGFLNRAFDLSGTSAVQSESADVSACAAACSLREGGCTGFEYGATGLTELRGCWTYLDGDADIQTHNQYLGWTTCTEVVGVWTVTRRGGWEGRLTKVDTFCGKSTDVFSIGQKPSAWCSEYSGGSEGQVILNQAGEAKGEGWFCSNELATEIIGVPTLTVDDSCANKHDVADAGN